MSSTPNSSPRVTCSHNREERKLINRPRRLTSQQRRHGDTQQLPPLLGRCRLPKRLKWANTRRVKSHGTKQSSGWPASHNKRRNTSFLLHPPLLRVCDNKVATPPAAFCTPSQVTQHAMRSARWKRLHRTSLSTGHHAPQLASLIAHLHIHVALVSRSLFLALRPSGLGGLPLGPAPGVAGTRGTVATGHLLCGVASRIGAARLELYAWADARKSGAADCAAPLCRQPSNDWPHYLTSLQT